MAAVGCKHLAEYAFAFGQRRYFASLGVLHALAYLVLYAFKHGDRVARLAVVYAPEHHGVGGVGSHHHYLSSVFLQWQCVVLVV